MSGNLGAIAVFNISIVNNDSDKTRSPLNSPELLQSISSDIISVLDLHVMQTCHHQFDPFGVTLLYLLSESHLAMHTWPENNCFSLDVHSCRNLEHEQVGKIMNIVRSFLSVQDITYNVIQRCV